MSGSEVVDGDPDAGVAQSSQPGRDAKAGDPEVDRDAPGEDFIKRFVPEAAGAWRCISRAILVTPSGQIQVAPGTLFKRGVAVRGFDLAALLDRQYEKLKPG